MGKLNEQQLEAVNSNERTILCLAGAGAGKTKTMLARIERQINEGVDPTSILALTFTNAAAFEMRERFKKSMGIDTSNRIPEFRTFHSFCYSLIIKDQDIRARLGYQKIPEICDDAHYKQLREKIKLQLGCKLTDHELDAKYTLPNRARQEQKELFLKALRKTIKQENLITFDIMCYNVCELFTKNDPCTYKYKTRYKYIYADEMQDIDPKQFKFITSFPETTSAYLCGDALQNIYAFRGCTNEYVKLLSTAPGWQVIRLNKNYRSTRQICEFANKFSKYASDDYRIPMEGQRDGDEVKQIWGSDASFNEPVDRAHLKQLVEMLKANKAESAILCRTNRECGAVKSALNAAGIEYAASSKSSDAIHLLASALDNGYMLEWLSSKLNSQQYADYIRLSAQQQVPDIRWFLSMYGNEPDVHRPAEKIRKIRTYASGKHTIEEKIAKICKVVKVKPEKISADSINSNSEIIERIKEHVEDIEENKIYVGTIHSAKGLEYDTVYVMGVNEHMFELGSEEMNNLYYVAITRPKNHLIVFRK